MKYKVIGENNYLSNDIRSEILKNRGINDINKFLNLDESIVTPPLKFKNMDKAVNCLMYHLNKKHTIYIYEDADFDGLSSSALLYNYLKDIDENINLKYIIHNRKVHGIKLKEIQPYLSDMDLLIIPDAASDNYRELKILRKLKIDVIILDHHSTKYECKNAIVVNNQLSQVSQNLCGVAMTYKFCKAVDDMLWEDKADNYLDLVATGLISDMMSLRDLEVQYYIREGLKKIRNKGLMAILDAQSYSMNNEINPISIAFYVTPLINAVFRLGSKEDYELMFKSFANINNETFIYEPKRGKHKGEQIEESIYEHVARTCVSFNGKRKRLSEKMLKSLNDKINIKNKILTIDIGQEFGEKGMTRLVANGLQRKYNKPTIAYYTAKDAKIKGSMAANTGDFQDRLNKTDLFEFVAGHQDASGLEIKKDKLKVLSENLEKEFGNEIFQKEYNIDFAIPFDDFNNIGGDIIEDIISLNDYFGRNFESPYVLITNICVDVKNVELLGTKKNTIKISSDEVSFIKFKSDEEEYSNLVDWKDTINLNVLGRCSINEYDGGRYPQIIVEDWEVLDSQDENNEEELEW